ncbi:MAG: leucine-rich repeat domain-containing protein, partial [Ruminococcus sp.]|nr:leucine-rich repeat domain-containing protein [Ruminococcus sp.]
DNQLTSLDVSKNTALTYLDCDDNQLTSLDVSKNTALEELYCYNNTYNISLQNGTFDLSTLPEGFNLDNASNWDNATIEGNVLTVTDLDKPVTYEYNLGNEKTATFTLNFEVIEINDENFPDEVFRNYVKENNDINQNGLLSATEISSVETIYVSNKSISDLKGIEYFTALRFLNCFNNNLTSLDVSNNTALTTLYCHKNNLTSIDLSKNTALDTLLCYNNNLTSIDVSKNTALEDLYCYNNNITSLDVSENTALTDLYCENNQLTSLDVSNNTALIYLSCENNNLTSLDVSKNTALEDLYCYNNTYNISLQNGTFDLSILPEGFNLDNALNWDNATIEGNVLTITNLGTPVTYEYNLGNEKTATFKLNPVSCTISESMISEIANYTYTGEAIEPIIEVKYGEYTLERDVDYTVTFENNINAGTATVVVKAMGTFFNGEFTTEFEINKANPTINDFTFTPPADLIYDGSEKAATVNVNNNILGMGNITIEYYSDETGYTEDIPSAAGEYIVHIIVSEGDNYAATETLFSDDWKFTIKKANPDYIIPIDLTAIYGETLADVELPDGFVWMISPDTSVGNAGKNTFMASYIPEDTTNYVVVDNIEITVDVAKAIPKVSVDIPDVEYTEGDPLPALIGILPDIYEGVFEWLTELANGLIAGENELEWQFTPDDTDNYEIVTGTAIINAQTTTTSTTTTTTTSATTTKPVTTTSTVTTTEKASTSSETTTTTIETTTTLPETTITTTVSEETESTTTTAITTLPQTGFSEIYNYIMFIAVAMILSGIGVMAKSRKRNK